MIFPLNSTHIVLGDGVLDGEDGEESEDEEKGELSGLHVELKMQDDA